MNLHRLWQSLEVPILETENGSTGYLDRIRPGQMTAPVMKGSEGGRRFIAILVTEKSSTTWEGKLEIDSFERVVVTFQRYYDDAGLWVVCGPDHCTPLCEQNNAPFPDERMIRQLIDGVTIEGEGGFQDTVSFTLAA